MEKMGDEGRKKKLEKKAENIGTSIKSLECARHKRVRWPCPLSNAIEISLQKIVEINKNTAINVKLKKKEKKPNEIGKRKSLKPQEIKATAVHDGCKKF